MRRLNRILQSRRFASLSPLGWGLLGLFIGLVGGLIYAWLVQPAAFARTGPARLNDANLADYLFLVSQSYAAGGDWATAERRLSAIDPTGGPVTENEDLKARVAAELEEYLRQGRSLPHVENMARLARQLGIQNRAVALFAPDPSAPSNTAATDQAILLPRPTVTPWPTPTFLPTLVRARQPSPTPRPAYQLLGQERACDEDGAPQIEIVVVNAQLEPVAAVEVIARWDGGEDRFYTGFKPLYGLGYADFDMTSDVIYQIELAEGSPVVDGLRVMPCATGQPGGWRLTFQGG